MPSFRAYFLATLLTLAPQQPRDDGFYALVDSGVATRSLAGQEIHLGEKVDEKVTRAAVRSIPGPGQLAGPDHRGDLRTQTKELPAAWPVPTRAGWAATNAYQFRLYALFERR